MRCTPPGRCQWRATALRRHLRAPRALSLRQGVLSIVLPRYTGVPPSPAAAAASKYLAARFGWPLAYCDWAAKQFDVAIDAGLTAVPLFEWYYGARLRHLGGDAPARKKTN